MEESLFLEDDPGVAGFFAEREKKSWFLSVHQLVSYSLFSVSKIHTTTPMGGGCLSIGGERGFCKSFKSRTMSETNWEVMASDMVVPVSSKVLRDMETL